MEEGEGIRRWLAIVLIIITIAIILLVAIFLPFMIEKVKSDEKIDTEFYIDFRIGNPVAVISLPPRLTEFKRNRDLVKVSVEAPFMNDGQIMINIRDLENLFPAQVLWNSKNRTIKVSIPSGIISKSQLVFTLTDKDFILRNNRAFISIRQLGKILKASEVFIIETGSFRLIWY